jgi:two-component system cell cycle response regulator
MAGKFLIAHPDNYTARLLQITLRDDKHTVLLARDGLDAIDEALDEPPDAILLGLKLEGLGGADVARTLRALEPTRNVPIIFLTDDNAEAQEIAQLALPLSDHLAVPLEANEVRTRCANALRMKTRLTEERGTRPPTRLAWITDPLTGLYQRHYLLHRLAYESARAARYKTRFALVLMALDDLAEIASTHGVLQRDAVLMEVAAILQRVARTSDIIGRAGENEFLIVAPHTDEPGARILAERLRQRLAEAAFGPPEQAIRLAVSFGVAATSGEDLSENLALLGRAEVALDHARAENPDHIAVG